MRLVKNPFSSIQEEIEVVVNEIFYSLQGESSRVGLPTIFIRLTGCPLRCQYCDTEYAFTNGEKVSLKAIRNKIKKFPTKYITVTGGEPLAQKSCYKLLTKLCDIGYEVSLETSGAINISDVDKRVKKIVDIKTPGSSEVEKNNFKNLQYLTTKDEIKFVICDKADYVWAKKEIIEKNMDGICEICFSPVYKTLMPSKVANWILKDQLNVRMQIQLHKHLWGDTPGK